MENSRNKQAISLNCLLLWVVWWNEPPGSILPAPDVNHPFVQCTRGDWAAAKPLSSCLCYQMDCHCIAPSVFVRLVVLNVSKAQEQWSWLFGYAKERPSSASFEWKGVYVCVYVCIYVCIGKDKVSGCRIICSSRHPLRVLECTPLWKGGLPYTLTKWVEVVRTTKYTRGQKH